VSAQAEIPARLPGSATQPDAASSPRPSRLRSLFGGSVGNLVEWYDWFTYSALALYFAEVFFPAGDQGAQLLQAAAVFAVGFIMRPVGSWVMGVYADRNGRRAALTLSMLVMGAGSLIIGIAPGYESIGLFAPIILLLARMLQGLSVGGEYGVSATYMSEMAQRRRRGFWSSFQYVTIIMGQLLAMGVLLLLQRVLTPEELTSWGWRIPFIAGAIFALLALWIRRAIDETESFRSVERRGQPVDYWKVVRQHPREFLIVLGLTSGGALAFYTYSTYMQKFLVNTTGFSRDTATEIVVGAMVVFMCMQPVMGWISDIVGRKPLLLAYGVLATLLAVPFMTTLAQTDSALTAFLLVTAALTIQSMYTSISGLYKAELFPAEIRALGVGLPYAIAISLVAGTGELLALSLKQAGLESWFYWYLTALLALFLFTAICMRDTQRHSKIVEE
jgi:MHS family alpha-ketoglutarate permease-like MFS transporter